MAEKLRQAGRMSGKAKRYNFGGRNGRYNFNNMQNVNILSRHHKRIIHWKSEFRNKYASNRWIQDSRGCGWGNKTTSKRFKY